MKTEQEDTVKRARAACYTEHGRLALYYLQGQIDSLASYCHIAPKDTGISRQAVHKLIEDLKRPPQPTREELGDDFC